MKGDESKQVDSLKSSHENIDCEFEKGRNNNLQIWSKGQLKTLGNRMCGGKNVIV